MNHSVLIVIPSCDAYRDAWNPFFHCINLHWPDCPFNKILITNHLDSPDPNTPAVKIGDDMGYSHNLKIALKKVDADYIILWLEDLLLTRKPQGDLQEVIHEAIKLDAGYLRLWQLSKDPKSDNNLFSELPKGSKFRISLKPALWKKSILEELIVKGESPHDLERKGTKRSNNLNSTFLSLNQHSSQYRLGTINLIYRGKYERRALDYLEKIGGGVNHPKRKIRPPYLYFLEQKVSNPILRLFKLLGR